MKGKKEITAPAWVVKEFEQRRQKAHIVNIASLRRSIRRREHIRNALAFSGVLVTFCGAGSMEFSDLNAPSMIAMCVGVLMVWVSAMMIRGGENE